MDLALRSHSNYSTKPSLAKLCLRCKVVLFCPFLCLFFQFFFFCFFFLTPVLKNLKKSQAGMNKSVDEIKQNQKSIESQVVYIEARLSVLESRRIVLDDLLQKL